MHTMHTKGVTICTFTPVTENRNSLEQVLRTNTAIIIFLQYIHDLLDYHNIMQ